MWRRRNLSFLKKTHGVRSKAQFHPMFAGVNMNFHLPVHLSFQYKCPSICLVEWVGLKSRDQFACISMIYENFKFWNRVFRILSIIFALWYVVICRFIRNIKLIYLSLCWASSISTEMTQQSVWSCSCAHAVHQIVCSVVTTPPSSLLSCDLFMHQPAWLLTCDRSTSLDAQSDLLLSWHAPTLFKAPQVFKCNCHFYQHVFIYIRVKWGTIVISCSQYMEMVWRAN